MSEVLEGVRVVDVTAGPVGGMATMVLADFGADVIKVEPPGGDRFRSLPAAPLWLRGKRSLIADLRTDSGLACLHALVAGADVLVVGGPPSRAHRWGIDAEAACALRPDLVHCSINGWGPAGPLAEVPGYEGAVAARSGRMLSFARQLRRGGPVFAAVPVAGHVAAHGAVQGILAGLIARSRTGDPQRVETSLLQGILAYDLVELLLVEMVERSGVRAPDLNSAGGDLPTLNYHPVPTKDGRWIQCGNLLEHLFYGYLDAIDLLGDMAGQDRFSTPPATWDQPTVEAARGLIFSRMQEKTADEWMAVFQNHGHVAAEPYLTTSEALDHPDIVAAGDVITLDDPVHGTVRTIGPIAALSRTPAVIGRPAPRPGEHTDEVLEELRSGRAGARGSAVNQRTAPGTTGGAVRRGSGGPLDHITIVDFSTIIAGPLCTTMLADLGARVIKVEPVGGDSYRHLIAGGTTAAKTTAGKSSICVNLKDPDGRQIAWDLARTADVVVHNTLPGVAERLGLGEHELRVANPGVVWVSLTGYGRGSPSASRPATHPCAGAAAGGAAYQAGPVLSTPYASFGEAVEISRQLIRANDSSPDPNTAAVAAGAVLMALLAREHFGMGQAVYINMLAANMYANADDALEYVGKESRPVCDPELHGLAAGYRLYPTAEGWVFLAIGSDAEWQRCAEALDRRDLAGDARFTTAAGRAAHDDALTAQIAGILLTRAATHWEQRFIRAGVAGVCADELTPGHFFSHHPQVLINDFSPECTHTRFGTHRRWGPVVRVNGGLSSYGPGVLAGEQTDEILAGLDRTAAEIARLRAAGVVASEPPALEL